MSRPGRRTVAANRCQVADAAYTAFSTQVRALSGNLISPTAARIMADDATYLINNCGHASG